MPPYSWNKAAIQAKVGANQALRFAQGQGYYVGPKLVTKPKPVALTPIQSLIASYTKDRQTPAQQLSLAQSLVNTSLAAQKAELEAGAKKAQLEAGQQAESARGFALALGGMDKANAQQVRDAYGTAGNDISKFGTTLAAALGQAQQGAIGQATGDAAARAPGSLVQAVDPSAYQNNANFQAEMQAAVPNALAKQYAIGGVPSDPLNPGASPIVTPAQARLASLGSQYVSQGLQARTTAAEAEAKLMGTSPGLVQQALQTIQSSGRSDDAALIQALYLMQTQGVNAVKNRAGVAAVTGVDPKTGKPTLTATEKQAQIESNKEKNRIANVNANTAKIKARTAARNAEIKAAADKAAREKTKDESTKTIRASYGSNAVKYLYDVLGVDLKHKDRGPKTRPPKKAELVRAIYGVQGAALDGKYGLTEKQLKAWANKAVETLPSKWWSDGYWTKKAAAAAAAKAEADRILGGGT